MICEFDCVVCGKHCRKSRSPSNVHTPPKYCSQKCHGDARRGTGHGITPNCRVTCEWCGITVSVYRPASALVAPRFCSLKCLGESQRGDENPAWTGGRHLMDVGYYVILAPEDPEADSRGYIYEHRYVARQLVGRRLKDGEVVHHIDGNKTNNAIENLMVFPSQGAHVRHHAELRRLAK